MAGAHQHPAILGNQREDVAGPDKVRTAGIAVGEVANRRGAVVGRDPGRRTVPIIDRNGEGGAVDRLAVGDHRRQLEAPGDLCRQRRADDARGVADDEGDLLGRRVYRREDQVAFVLTVVVVGHDDDFASGEGGDGLPDTGLGHGFALPTTPPG